MSALRPNGKWGTDRVQTSATGATFVTLPTHDCDEVLIVNSSGVALDLRAAGENSSNGIKIPDAGSPTIPVSANAQEIQIRRNDQSGTQVYVGFIFRKFGA
jgi:hypothetical protein